MFASKSPWFSVLLAVAALALLMETSPVFSAEKKADPNKEQVRRLQQAQRKLEQEKTQLTEAKVAAETELDESRKKAEGEARRAASMGREVSTLRSARDALAAKLAETEAELRGNQEQQRILEAEGKRLQAALADEKQQHVAALERNREMHKLGVEALGLYEKKTCLDSTLQGEFLTGLKRVEIENAVEDLREKLDSQRSGS